MIIFGDSTFTTDELNAYLLSHSLLAVSSDFSPSTESDQEAALLASDRSSAVSKVGRFALVIKHETRLGRVLNNSYISADEEILVVSLISVYCVGLHSVF